MFISQKQFIKANKRYLLASFALPVLIMALVYLTLGIYPGSSRSVLASDAFSQFSNFHASFRNMMLGKQGFFYTWNASLGLNYLSLVSYYLGGVFTPIVILFPNQYMPDALYFLTLLKIGAAGLTFWLYAKHSFKLPDLAYVILAIFYALMSFTTAHSELIMWLDAFVWLPLIIWGIDRLLAKKSPKLLFFSYLLMFVTSFYMGFMVALFSGLYFIARFLMAPKKQLKSLLPYFLTAGLATGASMVMILPAVLDLQANGETLSTVTKLKTEATAPLDLIMKNMVAVYDTTKYGSIPFIYAGLLPLALCLYYFISRKVPWLHKVLYASLFAILIASFYLVPLNLFWHGMHAPNMFLFRYAFLFSFLVVMLAGYGWEQLKDQHWQTFASLLLVLMGTFALAYGLRPKGSYDYIKVSSVILTLIFLAIYLMLFTFRKWNFFTVKQFTFLVLLLTCIEVGANTNGMLRGILNDWNYASRSLYTEPYPEIKELVDDNAKANPDTFYRLENLDPVSSNDGLNYGYSGISMFSSIRNRHSSGYLEKLGFRSRGTNLNIRYANNTLIMDSLMGIKYNLTKEPLSKYGFTKNDNTKNYTSYENENALPLGLLTDPKAVDVEQPANDNLTSQTNLLNALAGLNQQYFTFQPIAITETSNATVTQNGIYTTITEEEGNLAKDVTWQVTIPAHQQAYLSLYPQDYAQLKSSTVTLFVNGTQRKSQINITGQYYDLGYYDQETTISFTASFYGTTSIGLQNPQVLLLDTVAYQKAMDVLQTKGVTLNAGKHNATGTTDSDQEQLLVTTIPYEKGWHATIDGKKVAVTAFQDAFVAIKVPSGKHNITLNYLPQGLKPGAVAFVLCLSLFLFYDRQYRKKHQLN
ncbi:YfhO family protein [Enterococcus asini]|uniref:YfhO family protein n=1 Tax=Enterococcus asini TaxID=57732 RepID=UPI00288E4497|nr:YfhO family protein [Enterococcus asini]MDT2757135.1 YfhO family protein [Enterococcus asini]